uniref:Double jelly roll-like domain-containing protein n=1 Tax=Glossina morsitans morsitans TaxID=37546 RepID=A0A1B0G601_GLOMM
MINRLLKDIIKTREVLKAKLRNIKLNQIEKVNVLEDTFQPITKPLKRIIKKLDNKNSTSLTSSFTNGSIENHNNRGDEGDDDDDDEHNNEINDVNNIDYNDIEVAADNDVAMNNNNVEMPTYNSLPNYGYQPNAGKRRKTKTRLLKHGKSRSSAKTKKNLLKYGKSGKVGKRIIHNTPPIAAPSTNVVPNIENPQYVDYVGNQEEGEADFHNAEEDMNIDETSLESSSSSSGNSVNNLTTTYTSKMERVENDVKQFQNIYDLQMNSMKKQIDELYTTIKNDINSEAKQIEITLKNQLINANKSYMNKIEERFDKIEEYIFKWIGVEQLEEKFDKQLNSMKGDLIKLQTTLTSNVEEDVKLIEQSVKAYLNNENKEFINKTEERFQIIEDYLFKSIGLKQRQQQDKDEDGTIPNNIKLSNNCMAHLFDEIRYELNGIEIDRTCHLGITTEIKNFTSLNKRESESLLNAGWSPFNNEELTIVSAYFNFCIPLKMLLGFAEDFNKIIVNSKHELILLRSKDDKQAITTTLANEQIKLSILNITWKMPHVQLADAYKLEVFKKINSRQPLNICFRTWDMYYYPTLPQNATVLWNVKLASENERPRFLLIAFRNAENKFTHCNLTNVKVHLNSDSYPYDDLNLRFSRNQFALLYDMYSRFQQSYYLRDPYPLLKRNEFLTHAPIVVLDVTHQNESVKTGPVDIRIELKASMIGNPIPFTITTPQADSNSKTVEFNLTLSNDDVLRINISFVMMKVSEALETKDNDYLLRDQGDVTSLTASTTISPPIETPTSQQQQE